MLLLVSSCLPLRPVPSRMSSSATRVLVLGLQSLTWQLHSCLLSYYLFHIFILVKFKLIYVSKLTHGALYIISYESTHMISYHTMQENIHETYLVKDLQMK